MFVLSGTQALAPAIDRTRRLLFAPFRWGTFLKLCAVAVFTEGFGGNFNFSSPGHSSTHGSSNSSTLLAPAFTWSPGWIALLASIVVVSLVVGFLLFYLMTRLRFALFHCLVHEVKEIRPGWQLYREPANRFFKLHLAVALVFLFVLVLCVAPFAFGFFRLFRSTQAGAHLDIVLLLSLLLPFLALVLVIAVVAVAVDIVLRDFMLPHFALEDLSAGSAWQAVRARIAAEKGAFFLYAILRVLLPLAAMIGIFMVLAIPMLIIFGIIAILFAGVHGAIGDNGTVGAMVLGGAVEVVLGIAALAIAFLLVIGFGGPLSIWLRNYALVFYGGRYPLLGNVLFPPPPPPLYASGEVPAS